MVFRVEVGHLGDVWALILRRHLLHSGTPNLNVNIYDSASFSFIFIIRFTNTKVHVYALVTSCYNYILLLTTLIKHICIAKQL